MNVWNPEYDPVTATAIARARRDGAQLYNVQWTDPATGERWVTPRLPAYDADQLAADLRFNPGFDNVVVTQSN